MKRHPERSEGPPRHYRGVLQGVEISRFARNDRKGCRPEPYFLSPRGVSRGVPRHWRASGRQIGKLASGGHLEASSRTKCLMGRRPERCEGCLATLGRTWLAVDASLSLGRTKNGGSAGQSRGDFFEQPQTREDICGSP